MISGIYLITCRPNGRKYVGQSIDVDRRWSQHRRKANIRKHSNKIFQACWDKYGEDSFVFEILERCEEKLLSERESYWIDRLQTSHRFGGLNLEEQISSGSYRRKPSPETIQKRVSAVSKQIKAFGKYKTVREWCEIYNQIPRTVRWRLRKGWEPERALSTPSQKKDVMFNGKVKSLTEHCRELQLRPETIRCRIARGWSLDMALTVPIQPTLEK